MEPYGCITLRDAATRLGININVMHGVSAPKIIKKYIINKGTPNQLFDIDGYKQEIDDRQEIIEKTTLLIEYLFYEEEIDYHEMWQITHIQSSRLRTLKISYNNALTFLEKMCSYDERLIVAFSDYYDFPIAFDRVVSKLCEAR